MSDPFLFQGLTEDRAESPRSEPDQSASAPAPVPQVDTAHHDLPDRLRVHSLARVLGTTSKRVLDALTELDGLVHIRARSAHSSVERDEAIRVRELLATNPPESPVAPDSPGALGATETPEVVVAAAESIVAPTEQTSALEEPDSRLLLETPESVETLTESVTVTETSSAPAVVAAPDYMPLFVAPQPVVFERAVVVDIDDDGDDSEFGADFAADGEIDDDADNDDRPASRRRRRGRRGRGRGRGTDGAVSDDSDDNDSAEEADEAIDSEDVDADDESDSADEAGSRRRRRRRRRKSGTGDDDAAASDDPPNTVVHERAPRAKSGTGDDQIQGITGSTRLEAKRQRRRDGRDAGRRRPPILSEAEFLARREAVERRMVVRDRVRTEPPHQGARYTQIAVLEDGVMVEHFVTSAASTSLVGNVYLGIVQNVLPSMEAAFVDIGRGRNGVLYAGEVNWEAAGLGGANRKIEQALKPGDYVVVQVSKDPIGHKGARLTTQVSLAGRYLVYVPGASSTGISRKLPDTERQRLKEILREVVPSDAGVIIRTASEGVKEEDIRADVDRLQERWTQIEAIAADIKGKAAGAAVALYEEPDVLVKVIRDLFNEDFSELLVSGDDAWATINDYVSSVAPELIPKLTRYQVPEGPQGQPGPDVFAVHRIDDQLAKAMDRKVWLPSGGTLVIDRTEAMTVVDVNTGKFTGSGGNLEETVTKNNLEAAEEIVRQLRLRDIGGIIVIDFIDMVLESNRDLVLRRLIEALGRDRTRHQVSEVTSLGLVQLTRKRLGTGLVEAFSTSCQHCAGRGIMVHTDPVDSSAPGRKAETGSGRRGKRARKAKVDEPVVATIPVHTPGDHPMFKAMAKVSDHNDDEDGEEVHSEFDDAESEARIEQQVADDVAEEDLDDDLADDADDDEDDEDDLGDDADDDEDEVDLDDDEAEDFTDDLEDDDLEVVSGAATNVEDTDAGDTDAEQADAEDEQITVLRRPRRRAAARPAGPPI